jgi:hypothetical protein
MASRDRQGYILIDKNMCDWKWWQKHNTVIVFLWLLMKAQFHESYFGGRKIKRGQVATTYANIEQPNKLTRQEVRTAISNLKSTNAITIERCSKFIIITIVNYDEYQSLTIKSTKEQHSSNNHVTLIQPHTNKYNKYKEEERSKDRSAPVQPFPCGVTIKPEWMDDDLWDDVRFRRIDDIPVKEQGNYDSYIEYAEECHKQGRDIR